MMQGRRILVVTIGALATVALLAGPTFAGATLPPNTVTISKVVAGAVPAGTTFTVEVSCSVTGKGKGVPVVTDVVFDSTGAVTSGNSVIHTGASIQSTESTATETVTG